jgi:hypothetical protein
MTDTVALDRARQALEDHAWQDAYEAFTVVAADQGLSGEDLERLAEGPVDSASA